MLYPEHKTKLPSLTGWDLVRLAYEELTKKHNPIIFENFEYLKGLDPLLFSWLCIYYYADIVIAVVNEIQAEDSLFYTAAVPQNKECKIIFK